VREFSFRCVRLEENSTWFWLAAGAASRASLRNQIDGASVNIELTSIIIVDVARRAARVNCFARTPRRKVPLQFFNARVPFYFFGANVFLRELHFAESAVAPGGMFSNIRFSAEEVRCKNTIDTYIPYKFNVKLPTDWFFVRA
jgi:hypothetical protein